MTRGDTSYYPWLWLGCEGAWEGVQGLYAGTSSEEAAFELPLP